MNLSEIKNHLQQVLQLVEEWGEKGVDDLERDLALGKLREVYSQMRFGASPQPETILSEAEPTSTSTVEQIAEGVAASAEEEIPIGVAISLDDVFEGFIPEALMPEDVEMPNHEEPPFEAVEEAEPEEQATDDAEDVIEEQPTEVEADVPAFEVSSEEDASEVAAAEPIATETDEKATPEVADESVKSTTEPVAAAETMMGQPSLFGDVDLFVPRTSRRTKMMSLYDDEPAPTTKKSVAESAELPTPQPTSAPTPKSEPAPQPSQTLSAEAEVAPSTSVATSAEEVEIEVLDEEGSEEFVEVDLDAPATGQTEVENDTPTAIFTTETNYVEPKIEVAVATATASPVPESEQVLGEVIKSNVRTIADSIKPKDTAAEAIVKGSIDDIGKAVGINDRFLLIRDLFGGSSEEYERVVARLNEFDNFEDCMIYIVENFDWNPNSDGTKLMMELLERKYN